MKLYTIILAIALIVSVVMNIYQYNELKNNAVDIEITQRMKDWWYGAAVGCMETSGWWNSSKQAIIRNESFVWWDGYQAANSTIHRLKVSNNATT